MTVPRREPRAAEMGNSGQIHASAGDDLIASVTEMWVFPLFVKTFGTNGIKGPPNVEAPGGQDEANSAVFATLM
jgi:hypothetical protein